ncbi:MAG: TIGR03663 family protein [Pirellulales bacterium]|nr:TIGR03663 family protein [Pirellulales bacterium]
MKPRSFALILLLVGAGALAFRLPRLDDRPMHADESVHAVRFRDLWQRGRYAYDPNEFHGPTLVYATLPSAWLGRAETFAETSEATYRIVPVVFGAGVVLLVWLLGDAVGRSAAVCAAVLTAVSPAMVYYSRYYIHETLLVFFTLAAIGAGWRYLRSGRLGWCLAAGVSVGLMQATKETSVIVYFAASVALAAAWLWARRMGESPLEGRACARSWHLGLGLGAAVIAAAILYSSFFTNSRGLLDAARTYLPWLGRAGGASPHIHPWYEYLHRLGYWRFGDGPPWSEGLVLTLALAGVVFALLPGKTAKSDANVSFVRWLAFYTLALTAVYSAIPYKTPWCALGFLHGMIMLAGFGAAAMVRAVPTTGLRILIVLLLLAATGQLAWQAYRASHVFPADPRNPYVYAHTSTDIARLVQDVEELAKASPEGRQVSVKVIWNDAYYWPLPWCLRRLARTELWTKLPADPGSPLVIASPQYDAALTEELDPTHLMTGYYEVRPQVLAQLWVRMDLWEAHLKQLGKL